MYATINDTIIFSCNDTSWNIKNLCLGVRIDTISMAEVKVYDRKWELYEIRGQVFKKNQIFNFESLTDLKTYKINSFKINPSWEHDITPINSNMNCLSQDQCKLMEKYYNDFRTKPSLSSDKRALVLFIRIQAQNAYGNKIDLNDVGINISK